MPSVSFENCLCVAETLKAIQVEMGDGRKEKELVWIPKSQIDDDSEVWKKDQDGKLVVSEWIAEQKGLI